MLDVRIERHGIRVGEELTLSLQRTLRVPDDGRSYPLPPGLGAFPIHDGARLPGAVRALVPADARAVVPMHRREALWIAFDAPASRPHAIRVAIGGVDALTGGPASGGLRAEPQNYLVCPLDPWIDGIAVGEGRVRQFVAVPLGTGHTVEAARTGEERVGGIAITVVPPRAAVRPPTEVRPGPARFMGIGAGGTVRQAIQRDPYGIATWDEAAAVRIVVAMVDADAFREATGLEVPPSPVSARTYTEAGLPWFELEDTGLPSLPGTGELAGTKTIAERDRELGGAGEQDDDQVNIADTQVRRIPREEGRWRES